MSDAQISEVPHAIPDDLMLPVQLPESVWWWMTRTLLGKFEYNVVAHLIAEVERQIREQRRDIEQYGLAIQRKRGQEMLEAAIVLGQQELAGSKAEAAATEKPPGKAH